MGLSIWQIAVVVILFILLFGRGKLSGLMSDLGEGIKSFRNTMRDGAEGPSGDPAEPQPPARDEARQASLEEAARHANR